MMVKTFMKKYMDLIDNSQNKNPNNKFEYELDIADALYTKISVEFSSSHVRKFILEAITRPAEEGEGQGIVTEVKVAYNIKKSGFNMNSIRSRFYVDKVYLTLSGEGKLSIDIFSDEAEFNFEAWFSDIKLFKMYPERFRYRIEDKFSDHKYLAFLINNPEKLWVNGWSIINLLKFIKQTIEDNLEFKETDFYIALPFDESDYGSGIQIGDINSDPDDLRLILNNFEIKTPYNEYIFFNSDGHLIVKGVKNDRYNRIWLGDYDKDDLQIDLVLGTELFVIEIANEKSKFSSVTEIPLVDIVSVKGTVRIMNGYTKESKVYRIWDRRVDYEKLMMLLNNLT